VVIEHPTPLLEDVVRAAIHFGGGLVDRQLVVRDELTDEAHLLRDAFPLGHLRRGHGAFELVAERLDVRIVRQRGRRPRARRGGGLPVIACSRICLRGLGQPRDELPRSLLVLRGAEQHEARATGDRCARPVRSRQRHRAPGMRHLRRQTLAELGDVPGPVDVEAEVPAPHLLPHVGDAGVVHAWRKAQVEGVLVELQRALEPLAAEVAVAIAVAQQRLGLLHGEVEHRLELVERQQDRVLVRAHVCFTASMAARHSAQLRGGDFTPAAARMSLR
jgi:hypothetical protein